MLKRQLWVNLKGAQSRRYALSNEGGCGKIKAATTVRKGRSRLRHGLQRKPWGIKRLPKAPPFSFGIIISGISPFVPQTILDSTGAEVTASGVRGYGDDLAAGRVCASTVHRERVGVQDKSVRAEPSVLSFPAQIQ